MDALELLKKDHDKVENLFSQIEAGATPAKAKTLFTNIYHELTIHAIIEEQVFYPALARFKQFEPLLKDAYQEHAEAKLAMGAISNLDSTSEEWNKKVQKLWKDIQHHVKDEEEKLFPQVQQALTAQELKVLGDELKRAKSSNLDSELLSQPIYNQPAGQSQPQA